MGPNRCSVCSSLIRIGTWTSELLCRQQKFLYHQQKVSHQYNFYGRKKKGENGLKGGLKHGSCGRMSFPDYFGVRSLAGIDISSQDMFITIRTIISFVFWEGWRFV